MEWQEPENYRSRKPYVLRLRAPRKEKIFLDFEPLKITRGADGEAVFEEYCYPMPLRIFRQDYELLTGYINMIYPTRDAVDGRGVTSLDLCFYNRIGKGDWLKIISCIKYDINGFPEGEKEFFRKIIRWLEEALEVTDIIEVEGNL